jgi:hypothetical protein
MHWKHKTIKYQCIKNIRQLNANALNIQHLIESIRLYNRRDTTTAYNLAVIVKTAPAHDQGPLTYHLKLPQRQNKTTHKNRILSQIPKGASLETFTPIVPSAPRFCTQRLLRENNSYS